MERVRTVIAEDEALARGALRELVLATPWLELVGEAGDGERALQLVDELAPDLLFLDVVMPGISGLEVLERVSHHPSVVFTTAYEQYAVTAFELEALDYLVKPFGQRRFHSTMDRLRRRLEDRSSAPPERDRFRTALRGGALERLFARVGTRVIPVNVRDVAHFAAEGDYVRAHLSSGLTYLISVTLAELEQRLQPPFLRIHRSHIVNAGRIASIVRLDERRLAVKLSGGEQITASRAGSVALRRMIKS